MKLHRPMKNRNEPHQGLGFVPVHHPRLYIIETLPVLSDNLVALYCPVCGFRTTTTKEKLQTGRMPKHCKRVDMLTE